MNINFDLSGQAGLRRAFRRYAQTTERDINREMDRAMIAIQSKAKRRVPVRTGRLRSSIRNIKRYLNKTVFTNVHYARHVEYGTVKMAARPYMRPSWEEERPRLVAAIKRILGGRRL